MGGISGIALTKLDVLDGFDEIKMCTSYRRGGETYDYLPAGTSAQAEIEPVYETCEGWQESTRGARSWAATPGDGDQIYPPHRGTDRRPGRDALDQPGTRGHGAGARPVRRLT